MIDPLTLGFAGALLVVGAVAAAGATRGASSVVRLRRTPTDTVGGLAPGAVELAGRLDVVGEPLRSLGSIASADGSGAGERACTVVRHRLTVSVRRAGSTVERPGHADVTLVAQAELVDATGRIAVDLSTLLLVAPVTARTFAAAEFARLRPELWRRCASTGDDAIASVEVEEWCVPAGAAVFLSGVARPRAPTATAGYRGGRAGLVVGSEAGLPLVLSTSTEEETKRALADPSRLLAAAAALAVALAVALVAASLAVSALAG